MKHKIKVFMKNKKKLAFSVGSISLAVLMAIHIVPTVPLVTVEAMGYKIQVPAVFVKGEGSVSIDSNIALAASIEEIQQSGVYLQSGGCTLYGLVDYSSKEIADVTKFAYAKVEPSGCEEYHGNVKIRFDFFLTPDGYRYEDRYLYVVDWGSPEAQAGYQGKLDKEGNPVNLVQYEKWISSLPHIWQLSPFHSHFCYFAPDVTDDEINKAANYHLGNFYAAWCQDWIDVAGGMRHGWDVETRVRPVRYDKDPVFLEYDTLQAECITRIDQVKSLSISAPIDAITKEGETFPSTDIDVGSAAINRASETDIEGATAVEGANPANDDGFLDAVDLYAGNCGGTNNVYVGVFSASGNTLTCRDSERLGDIGAGLIQATGLDITVVSGDYIGACDKATGKTVWCRLDSKTSGGTGKWTYSGERIDPSDSATFTWTANHILSLYGTGETVVVCSEDISNTPSSENLGTVAESTTYYAKGSAPSNPVQDGECTFTITNSSGGAVDLTIKATNFTGGDGWTLTSDAPGSGTVRMTAYYSGQNPASGVVLTTSYQTFKEDVADAATLKWDFKLETGTFTDGTQKSSTITISAACSA